MKDKGLETDYKLIPMNEITDEARKIAVAWYHGVSEMNDIREKHKLASDIMNYARRYHTEKVTSGETTGENEETFWYEFERMLTLEIFKDVIDVTQIVAQLKNKYRITKK